VLSDLLGIEPRAPRFVRRYMDGASLVTEALNHYAADVKDARFPTCAESYS
jgi:3-methyl-2-oxobutanoate hydroxymethyltransferase